MERYPECLGPGRPAVGDALGNEYKNQIRMGLKIAKKQVAPELLLLPIDAPEAG